MCAAAVAGGSVGAGAGALVLVRCESKRPALPIKANSSHYTVCHNITTLGDI